MMNVVFTGGGVDAHGERIVRDRLRHAASLAGFHTEDRVSSQTHYLVASRTDTIKAKRASAMGVKVLDYPHFITLLRDEGITV